MLIKCPECELQVSDKALSCPHCGYPMKEDKPKIKRTVRKHKRLPNGFGQISEIHNRNLRKPFRAMITVGKTETGKPICKPLKPKSYFATYNDAYAALIDFNKNPYDIKSKVTMADLYKKWYEKRASRIHHINLIAYERCWRFCESIHDMDVRDVHVHNVKFCMNESVIYEDGKYVTANTYIKPKIKSLIAQLIDIAVEDEYVDKNVARGFNVSPELKEDLETKNGHIPFSDDEIKLLWANRGVIWADMMLIQCYSGWRPGELCNLKVSDIDVENWSFTGGMKTKAGKNRLVPIHSLIRELVKSYYDKAIESDMEYVFEHNYKKYMTAFQKGITEVGISTKHRLHDGRTHFVSMAKRYNVDEYAIKYLVGHAIKDLTERVYTKREFDWLKAEIEKIR